MITLHKKNVFFALFLFVPILGQNSFSGSYKKTRSYLEKTIEPADFAQLYHHTLSHQNKMPVHNIFDPQHTPPSSAPRATHAGQIETLAIKPIQYRLENGVKVFELTAQPIEKYIVDTGQSTFAHLIPQSDHHTMPVYKKKIKCWGYNGSSPGPTLEATEGDRVKIIVKNELPEPTSIHWHGFEIPNDQDGAAPETQKPILPGKTHSYEFTLYQSGTLMYHSGFNVMKQDHMGLSGMFVVHPKKYKKKPDKQFAIMLQQWSSPPGSSYLNLVSNEFNWFTFNGFSAPNIPVLTVEQGERVRIRFANIIMDSHPIHLHGYIWREVATEGGEIKRKFQKKSSTIHVPAGTTRDIEFIAWNTGIWRLHCHKLHHVVNAHTDIPMGIMDHGGMFTYLHVIPKQINIPWQHPKTSA